MKTASRTLVKSPPELWELIDQPERMQGLMCALVGDATEVNVYERQEESKLGWEATRDEAWIEVELAEKGWGTNVSVTAENGAEADQARGLARRRPRRALHAREAPLRGHGRGGRAGDTSGTSAPRHRRRKSRSSRRQPVETPVDRGAGCRRSPAQAEEEAPPFLRFLIDRRN